MLTAGLGTRLRPLTRRRAKPALPVAGTPLVERIAIWLRSRGIGRLLLNLHYRPDTVTAVMGDGSRLGVEVRYSWEMPLLGSGGGPRRAFSLVSDARLWLVNGDTLADIDLDALAREHTARGALVTLALVPNPAPDRYGGVLVDDDGAITGFVPRGTAGRTWHFAGIQLAERAAFAGLEDGVPARSIGGLYSDLMAARPGSVRGFRSDAPFLDIGTPREYLDTSLALAGARVVAGPGVEIAPTATVDRCVLLDGARVEAGARLRGVVVEEGTSVPGGFEAAECVLLPSDAGGPPVAVAFDGGMSEPDLS